MIIKIVKKIVFFNIILGILGVYNSHGAVMPQSLDKIICNSQFIVQGQVVELMQIKDVPVAKVKVLKQHKGKPVEFIYYLARGTWTCDTSKAILKEKALFFFIPYSYDPEPGSNYIEKIEADGSVSLTWTSGFKEPIGFKEELQKITCSIPFMKIYFAGRGRMPMHTIKNEDYVTVWTGNVTLPDHISSIDGPDPKFGKFIRSVKLKDITDQIRKNLK